MEKNRRTLAISRYLGSVIDKYGTIECDVDLRVQAAWSSWRKLTGILYDRKIPQSEVIRGHNQTGSGVWERMLSDEGDQHEEDCYHRDEDALRGILGVSRRYHMRNQEIRRILHLSPIAEVVRRGRLRWFGHFQRRYANNVTRRVMELAIPGTRLRGRPETTYS